MKSGVVALKIEATPLAMRVSPQAISMNGKKLLMNPTTTPSSAKRHQPWKSAGRIATITSSVATAKISRPRTSVAGETSLRPILMKRKDAPQIAANDKSTAFSRSRIA